MHRRKGRGGRSRRAVLAARQPFCSDYEGGCLAGLTSHGYQQDMSKRVIRILGIDPGLRRTGWGLIECEGNRLIFVACGSVDTDAAEELAMRLVCIHDGLV